MTSTAPATAKAADAGRNTLFSGRDVTVYATETGRRDFLVVTFTGHGETGPDRNGAGSAFLAKYGLSGVHFLSHANRWWQTPELDAALDAVRAFADAGGYGQVVTYGSSMGGYGALVASRRLRADRVVAMVPQATVDPAKVPWDRRFRRDALQIDFVRDDLAAEIGDCDVIVMSDPYFDMDRRHLDYLRSLRPVRAYAVAFAEHDVSAMLAEAGILSMAVLGAYDGTLDERDFLRALRAGRGRSAIALAGAARQLNRRGRHPWALRLARRALEMMNTPGRASRQKIDDRLIEVIATVHIDAGEGEAALDLLAAVEARARKVPAWLQGLRGKALERLGRRAEAHAAYGRAVAERPTDRLALTSFIKTFDDAAEAADYFRGNAAIVLRYPSSAVAMTQALIRLGEPALARDAALRGAAAFPAERNRFDRILGTAGLERMPPPDAAP